MSRASDIDQVKSARTDPYADRWGRRMTTIDRRGAAYNWMTEEAAGQVDVGGGWFVRATARQPQPDQPRYIELKLWERTDTGFRPGQQRLTLPIDAIPEMHRLLDEAARLSTWRWSESQPEAS